MTGPVADAQAALAAIWAQNRPTMLERVEVLDRAACALDGEGLDDALAGAALDAAHQLAGAVGTFGYREATERAREAEAILRGTATLTGSDASRLRGLAASLRSELAHDPFSVPAPGPVEMTKRGGKRLLVIDDDELLAGRLAREGGRRGLRVAIALDPSEARVRLQDLRPDAILLDLGFGDGPRAGLELLSELVELAPGVPVLVFTAHTGFEERIEVARRGAAGFLEKSLSPGDALDQVSQVLERDTETGTRILAVDDDPVVLATTAAMLAASGHAVTTLGDPLRFWDEIERIEPALIMLDIDMPGASGIELTRMLRNDPRWAAVPIVVMTARTDSETISEVFGAGADDFLLKPVAAAELSARVENRLDRFRLHQVLADTDGLTGLSNRRASKAAINQLLGLAARAEEAVCVAEIDLDCFKAVNDQYGHAAGDGVLRRLGELMRRSFRGQDVVARWGGEEFVIALYGPTRDGGVARIQTVLESFRTEVFTSDVGEFSVTFSAGVAQFPADGEDLDTLYRAADEALYEAKEAGRDRIVASGAASAPKQEMVDVAIIEDDDATAAVIAAIVGKEGYTWQRFSNGLQATGILGGKEPEVRAGMVLLDVEMPALNGFEVLQLLGQDGVLAHTRVLMLTARIDPADIARALQLGAFDHLPKPFDAPTLMQKVRRSLER
jgi:diguanylate cyclase (GGDEF)-like protein